MRVNCELAFESYPWISIEYHRRIEIPFICMAESFFLQDVALYTEYKIAYFNRVTVMLCRWKDKHTGQIYR